MARADDYVQSRENLLTKTISDIVGTRTMGVALIPIGDAARTHGVVGFHIDDQSSVASAFKGPVAVYFFENVDPAIWKSYPVRYWNEDNELKIPDEYDAAWKKYHHLLHDMYQMLVFSENDATGNILGYVYETMGKPARNAIIAFNNWSVATVGISTQSGLNAWYAGKSSCVHGCVDIRYGQQILYYRDQGITLGNSYSPRDLATFYVRLATHGREIGYYDTAMELLSIRREYPSMTKTYAVAKGIAVASKDGFIAPYIPGSNGWYVSTDAGIFTLPNGEQYAVAFMALGSGDLLEPIIDAVCDHLLPDVQKF
jgi:hypothetical protein